jgi:16S rRNA C967 or C1407 C5-methylase (RsmB/RsmF family)/NOL1/NOP2/fmu family ribosome biogenesis protein
VTQLNNLPADFVANIQQQLGSESTAFFDALKHIPYTSIRLNPSKKIQTNYLNIDTPISWCKKGYFLASRPSYVFDPHFHAGCYYPQESSSMFLEHVYKQLHLPDHPLVLDMCAAPGGKSTHLLQLMQHKGILVSNETIKSRNEILKENIIKCGYHNVLITQNEAVDFEKTKETFDLVLLDAPCSGEGLFRKDENAVNHWSVDNVNLCAARQLKIFSHAYQSLKPGGYIIYSTCTYNELEDELNVARMLQFGMSEIKINIADFSEITVSKYGLKFYPHKVKGEGFYIALLQKEGKLEETTYHSGKKFKHYFSPCEKTILPFIKNWINSEYLVDFMQHNDKIYALPKSHFDVMSYLITQLNVVYTATPIAEKTKNGVNPTHELTQSVLFNKEAFPILSLQKEEAIAFLRKETITIDGNQPIGWNIVCFENSLLGWIKNIGKRTNNYYPTNWRIRI